MRGAKAPPLGSPMTIKVAINGYGTIGKRVADAVACQDDMEIIGVTKTRPAFGCDLAVRKGYPLYCTFDNPEKMDFPRWRKACNDWNVLHFMCKPYCKFEC